MNLIDNYYLKFTEKLTFLQLSKSTVFNEVEIEIDENLPLPILVDNLVDSVKNKRNQNEIDFKEFIEGMIFTLGCSKEFKYVSDYRIILAKILNSAIATGIYRAASEMEKDNMDMASVYLRGLKELDKDNVNSNFNLAICYERIAQGLLESQTNVAEEFIMQSTKEFENILSLDTNYALAWYKLGYHYRYYGQFLKSKIHWREFLKLTEDETLSQEIRNEMETIEIDAAVEIANIKIARGDFNSALTELLSVNSINTKRADYKYILAWCYNSVGRVQEAIASYEDALKLDDRNPDIYNELASIKFNLGEKTAALEILNEGVEKCENEYALFFNRGIIKLDLGEPSDAMSDITLAHSLNPEDANVRDQYEALKKYLESDIR